MYLFQFLYNKIVLFLLYYGAVDVSGLYKFLRLLNFVLTSFTIVIPFFCIANKNSEFAASNNIVTLFICGFSYLISVIYIYFMKKKRYVEALIVNYEEMSDSYKKTHIRQWIFHSVVVLCYPMIIAVFLYFLEHVVLRFI